MKKVLSLLFFGLFLGIGMAQAGDITNMLEKLPNVNQAVIYSFDQQDVQYASTVTLATFKEKVDLDLFWTPKNKIGVDVSAKLVEVKNYIQFPILNYVVFEPMIYVGLDRIENLKFQNAQEIGELDWGVGAKLLEIKF